MSYKFNPFIVNLDKVSVEDLSGYQTLLNNSAGLLAALDDETGIGLAVFNTSPTLITPVLGTPTSGTLTNCTFPTLNQNTTGTAANLSGTPALPDGTTATTQGAADNSTKLATTAYADAAAAGGGATTALDNLASVQINTTLVSDTDITDDLGTGDVRWKDIHAATLNAGLTAADTLKLRARDVDGSAYVDILTIISNNTVTADLNAITTIGGNAILYSGGDAGTPSALVGTNISGTASGLTAGAVTNATLTTALTVNTGTLTLTANVANNSVLTIGAGAVSVSGANTGDQDLSGKADVDQTMHIGTTAVAINRASAALTLAGLTLTTPDIGTPSAGTLTNCSFPTLNQNTTGSSGSCTGESATVATITGLAPDTATTQATQASITTCANLVSIGTIATGVWAATDVAIAHGGTGASTLAGASIPTYTSTITFTNKRITQRVTTEASSATPTINTDNSDMHSITALATAITSMTTNLSGTPTNGQKLIIRILDNATGRAITWGASFEDNGVALPSTTTASKLLTVGFIYDTASSKWGCVAVANET